MKDSAIQIGSEVGEAAAPTELTERLLRRAAEPLGVIDVRRPQRQYARTAGWVAQRFALLDHWRTRYLSEGDVAEPGANFVFAARRRTLTEPSQSLSSPIQLARMARQSVVSQPDAGATASLSEQFRIRRRGVAPASSPRIEAPVDARPDSATPAEGDPTVFNSSISSGSPEYVTGSQPERGELRVAEIPSITTPTVSELILPKRLTGNAETTSQTPAGTPAGKTGIPRRRAETLVAAAPAQSPVSVSCVEAKPSSLPPRLQRKVSEATTSLARERELTGPATSAAPAPSITMSKASRLILPKRSTGSVEAEPEAAGGPASSVERRSRREEASHPAETTAQTPPGNPAGKTGVLRYSAEAPVAVAPSQSPVSVNRVEAKPSSLPPRLQRKVSEATTSLARERELTGPATSAAPAPMLLAEFSAGQPPSSASQLREPPLPPEGGLTNEIPKSFAERTVSMGTGASLAKVELPSSFPLIQRRPAGASNAVETAPGEVVERRAASMEIRATRGGSPEPAMVWRQSAQGSSSGSGSAAGSEGLRMARQAITAESTSQTSADGAQPAPQPETPPAGALELDVARLAEQVSRLLARQLVIERERRGKGGWR